MNLYIAQPNPIRSISFRALLSGGKKSAAHTVFPLFIYIQARPKTSWTPRVRSMSVAYRFAHPCPQIRI